MRLPHLPRWPLLLARRSRQADREATWAIEEARRVIETVERRPRSDEPVTAVLRGTWEGTKRDGR